MDEQLAKINIKKQRKIKDLFTEYNEVLQNKTESEFCDASYITSPFLANSIWF